MVPREGEDVAVSGTARVGGVVRRLAAFGASRVVAWLLVLFAVAAASGTVWLRTQDVELSTAVALGAQAVAGPLFAAIGAVIVQRRPGHAMGWLFLVLGVASSFDELTRGIVGRQELPSDEAWMPPVLLVSDVLGSLLWIGYSALLPLLFPDGRVPSRRWRPVLWALVALSAIVAVGTVFVEGPLEIWVDGQRVDGVRANPLGISPFGIDLEGVVDAAAAVAMLFVFLGLAALVVKWRRDAVSRQQIKWFLFGFALAVAGITLTAIPALQSAGDVVSSLAFVALPITMGIAITRYRLFEIDRLLSRTVSYLVVVAGLVGLYAGSVLGLSAVARALTGESGDVVVALSTLVVAAAFQPLRSRVQAIVERRFNRRRYDANRTLERFGRSLRDELDGDAIAAALGEAAARSLQPRGLSVLLTSRTG